MGTGALDESASSIASVGGGCSFSLTASSVETSVCPEGKALITAAKRLFVGDFGGIEALRDRDRAEPGHRVMS